MSRSNPNVAISGHYGSALPSMFGFECVYPYEEDFFEFDCSDNFDIAPELFDSVTADSRQVESNNSLTPKYDFSESIQNRVSPLRPALQAKLWTRLSSFQEASGEDGNDDVAPVSPEVTDAVKKIITLVPNHVRLPQLTKGDDGEVALTWFFRGNRLDATFEPDGYFTWVASDTLSGNSIDFFVTQETNEFQKALVEFFND